MQSDFSQYLIGLIKEAIVAVDEQANVVYWNSAAEKTFGYTSKEVLGKNIHELVVPTSKLRTRTSI